MTLYNDSIVFYTRQFVFCLFSLTRRYTNEWRKIKINILSIDAAIARGLKHYDIIIKHFRLRSWYERESCIAERRYYEKDDLRDLQQFTLKAREINFKRIEK